MITAWTRAGRCKVTMNESTKLIVFGGRELSAKISRDNIRLGLEFCDKVALKLKEV
jgi:hypothetical protein